MTTDKLTEADLARMFNPLPSEGVSAEERAALFAISDAIGWRRSGIDYAAHTDPRNERDHYHEREAKTERQAHAQLASCHGSCEQWRKPCGTPDACRLPERSAGSSEIPMRILWALLAIAFVLASARFGGWL